jgi:hypothetical protein
MGGATAGSCRAAPSEQTRREEMGGLSAAALEPGVRQAETAEGLRLVRLSRPYGKTVVGSRHGTPFRPGGFVGSAS